jgi:hypothetical protein
MDSAPAEIYVSECAGWGRTFSFVSNHQTIAGVVDDGVGIWFWTWLLLFLLLVHKHEYYIERALPPYLGDHLYHHYNVGNGLFLSTSIDIYLLGRHRTYIHTFIMLS